MSKISQTGHDQNCAKFGKIYELAKSKSDYTPADAALEAPNLLIKLGKMKLSVKNHNIEAAKWGAFVNIRHDGFKLINPFATKVKNTVLTCNVSDSFKKDVVAMVKKIQGIRATPKIKLVDGVPTDGSIIQISAAQTGFDNKLAFMAKLREMLDNEPNYTPQVDDQKVVNITARLASLNGINDDVNEQFPIMDNKRLERNKELYDPTTGGVFIGKQVKKAFKSIYGGNSAEFHQVAKFKLTTPKL